LISPEIIGENFPLFAVLLEVMGKLSGNSVFKHDVELIKNNIPISTALCPAFDNLFRGKIE
jgi:hypothetical protein